MYKLFRDTHLLLGLFSCLFLLMYGISSVQLAHPLWFHSAPAITITQVTLSQGATDARVVAREMMDKGEVRGDVNTIRAGAQTLSFNVVRPGTVDQVNYAPATGLTTIHDNRAGFVGLMNRLHHAAGFGHDYWWGDVWAVFIAIVSVGLFVIGVTGVYLWFVIHTERVIGAILLVGSLGYSITLLVLIRIAH